MKSSLLARQEVCSDLLHFLRALSSVGCSTHSPSSSQERGSVVPATWSCHQPAELARSLLAWAPCCPAQRAPLYQQETLWQEKSITGSWAGWGRRGQSCKALIRVGGQGKRGCEVLLCPQLCVGEAVSAPASKPSLSLPFYLSLLCAWVWRAQHVPSTHGEAGAGGGSWPGMLPCLPAGA